MIIVQKIRRVIFYLLFLAFYNSLSAQDLGIYVSPGLINYGGDLQNTVYTFNQSGFVTGAGATYRIKKFVVRAGVTIGKIQGSDSASSQFKKRNLSFQSQIFEGSLGLEYDIFDLDEKKFTPYGFAGVAVYHYDPYTYYNGQKVYLQPLSTEGQGLSAYPGTKPYSLTQFAVPLGIGFKYKVSEQFHVGVEFCSRFLFNDYLDDASSRYPDETILQKEKGDLAVDLSFRGDEVNPGAPFPVGNVRGNPDHNDNYYTSSLTLIYVFSNRSEFSGSGSGHRRSRSVGCPKL